MEEKKKIWNMQLLEAVIARQANEFLKPSDSTKQLKVG